MELVFCHCRLDRYQRAAKANQVYDDEARKKLFDKINRVAANLGVDEARNAGQSKNRARREGPRRRKKKCPGGSAQPLEKAQFGQGNQNEFL